MKKYLCLCLALVACSGPVVLPYLDDAAQDAGRSDAAQRVPSSLLVCAK